MSYYKKNWVTGEALQAHHLNRMEAGIEEAIRIAQANVGTGTGGGTGGGVGCGDLTAMGELRKMIDDLADRTLDLEQNGVGGGSGEGIIVGTNGGLLLGGYELSVDVEGEIPEYTKVELNGPNGGIVINGVEMVIELTSAYAGTFVATTVNAGTIIDEKEVNNALRKD